MSTPEENPLVDVPELEKLSELETRQATLQSGIDADDFATPQIREAYRAAHQTVVAEIEALVTSSELHEKIAHAGEQALKAVCQLDPLRGVLPAEEISAMEAGPHEVAVRVGEYYRKYYAGTPEAEHYMGILSGDQPMPVVAAAAIPAAPPLPPARRVRSPHPSATPEATSQPPKPITLRLGEEGVRISERGQVVPYTFRVKAEFRAELTQARKAMVKYIAESEDALVSVVDLWPVMYGPDRPYHAGTMMNHREWLSKLTYNHKPLVVMESAGHAGFRVGFAPEYDISIKEAAPKRPPTNRDEMQHDLPGYVAGEYRGPKLGGVHLNSFYIMAQRLTSHSDVLAAYDVPLLDARIMEDLEDYRLDLSHLKEKAVLDYRESSIEEVQEAIENDERLAKLIEALSENENEALTSLIEYLVDLLDKPEQRKFISRLMGAQWRTRASGPYGEVDSLSRQLIDQRQNIIWPVEDAERERIAMRWTGPRDVAVEPGESESDSVDEASDEKPPAGIAGTSSFSGQQESDNTDTSTVAGEEVTEETETAGEESETQSNESDWQSPSVPNEAGVVLGGLSRRERRRRKRASLAPVPPKPEKYRRVLGGREAWVHDERKSKNAARRAMVEDLEDFSHEIAVRFIENFDPSKGYARPHLQGVFPELTTRIVSNARENNIGPKGKNRQPEFTMNDVVRILLYSNEKFQNLTAHKKKRTQDMVSRVIGQGIVRAQAEHSR